MSTSYSRPQPNTEGRDDIDVVSQVQLDSATPDPNKVLVNFADGKTYYAQNTPLRSKDWRAEPALNGNGGGSGKHVFWSYDGLRMFRVQSDDIFEYTVDEYRNPNANRTLVGSIDLNVTGLITGGAISKDGTKFAVITEAEYISLHTLTTAGTIVGGVTLVGEVVIDATNGMSQARGLQFSEDELNFYVTDTNLPRVHRFTMPTPFDVLGHTELESFDTGYNFPFDHELDEDNKTMYVVGLYNVGVIITAFELPDFPQLTNVKSLGSIDAARYGGYSVNVSNRRGSITLNKNLGVIYGTSESSSSMVATRVSTGSGYHSRDFSQGEESFIDPVLYFYDSGFPIQDDANIPAFQWGTLNPVLFDNNVKPFKLLGSRANELFQDYSSTYSAAYGIRGSLPYDAIIQVRVRGDDGHAVFARHSSLPLFRGSSRRLYRSAFNSTFTPWTTIAYGTSLTSTLSTETPAGEEILIATVYEEVGGGDFLDVEIRAIDPTDGVTIIDQGSLGSFGNFLPSTLEDIRQTCMNYN